MYHITLGTGYCQTGVIEGNIIFNLALAVVVYILIKITDNWSWMDRLWGLMPIAFSTHFLFHPYYCQGEKPHKRQILMAALIVMWGLRLAHTLWRKGIYSPGGEDPRLTKIKKQSSALKKEVMIIFFLCLYQPMLSMLMTSAIVKTTSSVLNGRDIILFVLGVVFLVIEGTADNQQYSFQCQKKKYQSTKRQQMPERIKIGFPTTGLWAYSRHPNYFGQICFWWVICLFSQLDAGLNIVVLGVIQYTIFFQSSVAATEEILLKKYPMYKIYRDHVSKIIPLPNRFQAARQRQI